jgi:hypothetical protein
MDIKTNINTNSQKSQMKTKSGLVTFFLFILFGFHNSHEHAGREKQLQNGRIPCSRLPPQGHGDGLNEGREGFFLDDLLHAGGIVYSFNDTS